MLRVGDRFLSVTRTCRESCSRQGIDAAAANSPLAIDPEALLRRLEFTVLRRLDGLLQGDYRTLLRGFGLDLADLREYQLHDDVRYIDWNVTARLQTPHVREFQEDREVAAWFLLDLSRIDRLRLAPYPQAHAGNRTRRDPRAPVHSLRQSRRRCLARRKIAGDRSAAQRSSPRAARARSDAQVSGHPASALRRGRQISGICWRLRSR